jgi:hypothetical protein
VKNTPSYIVKLNTDPVEYSVFFAMFLEVLERFELLFKDRLIVCDRECGRGLYSGGPFVKATLDLRKSSVKRHAIRTDETHSSKNKGNCDDGERFEILMVNHSFVILIREPHRVDNLLDNGILV